MEPLRLVRAYRDSECGVKLWGRNADGKFLFSTRYEPYFFVLSSEARSVVDAAIARVEPAGESCFGDRISKIVVINPSEVPRLRDKFSRTWEADVPFARRFIGDKGILSGFTAVNGEVLPCYPPDVPVVVGFLDLECFTRAGMPDPQVDPITCVTVAQDQEFASIILDDVDVVTRPEENWVIIHISDERKIIEFTREICKRFDVLAIWNAEFDLEYLEKRATALKVPWDLDSVNSFDLLVAFRSLYRKKSYRLKDVALEEGLTTEIEEPVDYGALWEKDKPALLARNKRHCQWVSLLEQKHRVVEYYTELKEMAGLESLQDVFHTSVLIDTMLLRRSLAPLPTKQKHEAEHYEGALVIKPPAEVVSSVAVFDLSRFYPNVLLNERLDPMIVHSYLQSHETPIDWNAYKSFSQAYHGRLLILDLVVELMAERDRLQASGHLEKLAAIKGLVNSLYGVLAYPGFRLFMREIPEKVTEVARQVISALAERVKVWGYRVLYLDTDSLFLQIPKNELPVVEARLNKTLLEFGNYAIKMEHYTPSILFTGAKKRYAFLSENSEEVHFVGYEHVRTDSSNYTKRVQEEVVKLILTGRVPQVIPYLRDLVQGVRSASLEDIAISKSIGREFSEYKVLQDYMLAAQAMGLHAGDSVKVIQAKNYAYGVAVFRDLSELTEVPEVDYEAIVEKQVKNKVENFLSLIHRSWSEVTGQARLF